MKHINSIILLILIYAASFSPASAQVKRAGLPLINNFTRNDYNASTQNWAIDQDSRGMMYFANNDGLLIFDGQHWSLLPMPNRSIVRSVFVHNDTVFVGAFEEFGFFAANAQGRLVYHSLVEHVPDKSRSFDEVWKIFNTNMGVVFQSFKYLFYYDGKGISHIIHSRSFGHSYKVGNDIYITDHERGLLKISNGKAEQVSDDPLFRQYELRCMLPYRNGKMLVGLINKGVFVLSGSTLTPWDSPVNNMLIENNVFSGIRMKNGLYAFGSIQNGLYIADEDGVIHQQVNRYKGLQNNTILSIAEDRNGNLWLGLDNGIDHLEVNSPLSIYDHTFHIESTYASVVHNGTLYIGTNQGLFYTPVTDKYFSHHSPSEMQLIPGTEGQVWSLQIIDNQLLCGHNFGSFHIQGTKAVQLADDRGYWTFIPHNGNPDTLICGTYNGLNVFVRAGESWKFANKIGGFSESSKNVVQQGNELWIAHGYRGIYKVKVDTRLQKVLSAELYNARNGLPASLPYNVHLIQSRLMFTTVVGLMQYDPKQDLFIRDGALNQILGDDERIDNLMEDPSGSIWFFSSGRMGLLRLLEDGTYSKVTAPFGRMNNALIGSYENVYVHDSRNVFIGSKTGLIHYDPFFKKEYRRDQQLIFREIIFSGESDPVQFFNLSGSLDNEKGSLQLPFSANSVRFRFAFPSFEAGGDVLFSFRLRGFDQNWSDWDKTTFKEYTNLYEGRYIFEVRVRSVSGFQEDTYQLAFQIRPPWHRSIFAYTVYVIFLIILVVSTMYFIQKKISKTVKEAEERHEKELQEQELSFREQALIAEKEIINLKNQSLQSQIDHKNRELANTTLHIIHKNKILNAIKFQLSNLVDGSVPMAKKQQFDQLLAKINKELKNEKFQELFDDYFDDVHQDFISRLKESHSELSARELRLCAYLKMNLSTKEIAPLMNISIRGVEIGRYRLRKKLNLDRDESLLDYLLKF